MIARFCKKLLRKQVRPLMFRFVDRKKKEHLAFIPGWGFDGRVFANLDLPYNYYFFDDADITKFEDELKKILPENNIERISIFGWSQGAFEACNFASKNPGIVEEIILVSVRKRYEKENLNYIKKHILKNRTAFMCKFYRQCFCAEDQYSWFKIALLKDYLDKMSTEMLVEGLDWLGQVEIRPELLKGLKCIKIIHGKEDKVAPVEEAVWIANSLPQAELITFEEAGHLPFLQPGFEKRLYE